jgi:TonB family protein
MPAGPRREVEVPDPYVIVSTIHQRHAVDIVPLPKVALFRPGIEGNQLRSISFGDRGSVLVNGIVASRSAPQLDPTVKVDSAVFATRAGLSPGDAVTVVLSIEVLANGSTGNVEIVSGSGDSAVDAAAIDCARSLRWIPGTMDQEARTMRINYSLTLAIPARL